MIWAKKDLPNNQLENDEIKLDLYGHMAHYVGRKLKIRPVEILTTWGVPELIVTYGELANQDSQRNFAMWEVNKKGEMPKKYFVKFYDGE